MAALNLNSLSKKTHMSPPNYCIAVQNEGDIFTAGSEDWLPFRSFRDSERSSQDRKNTSKIPKKIHKAVREKQKRDSLNELFFELGNVVKPAQPNSGKASLLSITTRLLQDLICQINSLSKENDALLHEFQYITVEKNELKEEKLALEAKTEKLKRDIEERNRCSVSSWDTEHIVTPQQHLEDPGHSTQPTSILGPVYVIPLCQDIQAYPEIIPTDITSKVPSNVKRPRARYPSPSDEWPSQILSAKNKSVTSL